MLRDLKTNLKSLQFGKDVIGGGSSGLPYIKPGLPEDSPGGEYLASIARNSGDWPLRGGQYWTVASTEDAVRISRFLTDFPRGTTFTSKQVQLQKSNPKIETGGLSSRLNTQTYNLNANLLAQVLEQGSGIHIPRPGSNANELSSDNPQAKYEYIVSHKDTDQNRLVNLFNTKILSTSGNSTTVNLGLSNDPNFILDYPGGPGSTYGDGNTVVARAVNTDIKFNYTLNYTELANSKAQSTADLKPKVFDFRYENPLNQLVNSRDYSLDSVNIATRVGIGNPGGRPLDQRKYINQVYKEGQDKINMIPIYSDGKNPFLADAAVPYKDKYGARDLIKFAFEVIDNDILADPKTKDVNSAKFHFRAFLTNFSDSHTANWNGQKYMGRGEDFYTYQGFNREVSFQFKVAAQSKQEMMPLYQKLNSLVSSLYPDYQEGTGFMRGNIIQLTIGEYFYRTPGILKSMNITVDDNSTWEIKMDEPESEKQFTTNAFPNPTFDGTRDFQNSNSDADMMELPQILNVSCTFTPILTNLPAYSKLGSKRQHKGMLISDNIGREENFIQRIGFQRVSPPPLPTGDPESPTLDVQTPPVTTTTTDVNSAPAAVTATSTQAPPAESWVPNTQVAGGGGSVTGPSGTATWVITRTNQQGFFYWTVTSPDQSSYSGTPSSLFSTVYNDAKAEATSEAGL